jgi:hypothetical protein
VQFPQQSHCNVDCSRDSNTSPAYAQRLTMPTSAQAKGRSEKSRVSKFVAVRQSVRLDSMASPPQRYLDAITLIETSHASHSKSEGKSEAGEAARASMSMSIQRQKHVMTRLLIVRHATLASSLMSRRRKEPRCKRKRPKATSHRAESNREGALQATKRNDQCSTDLLATISLTSQLHCRESERRKWASERRA